MKDNIIKRQKDFLSINLDGVGTIWGKVLNSFRVIIKCFGKLFMMLIIIDCVAGVGGFGPGLRFSEPLVNFPVPVSRIAKQLSRHWIPMSYVFFMVWNRLKKQ